MTFPPMRLGRTLRLAMAVAAAAALSSCMPQRAAKVDPAAGSAASAVSAKVAASAAEKPAATPAATPAAPASAKSEAPAAAGPLEITVQRAILTSLGNNQELVVQQFEPEIMRTWEREARAEFDPVAEAEFGEERVKQTNLAGNPSRRQNLTTDSLVGKMSVEKFFPTGTTVEVGATTEVDDQAPDAQLIRTRLGLTVTQALLRGFGPDVNLVDIRQARLDTLSSEYELRGFAQSLIALVEHTCWSYQLDGRQVEIRAGAVALAEQMLRDIQERVKAGTLPAMDMAAAEAEVARVRQDLIDALSTQQKDRLLLIRLLGARDGGSWGREIRFMETPAAPDAKPEERLDDVESHVQVALRMRPDLNQARLQVQRGDLQVVKTRNGLLPKLDLFVTLGKSGYGDSFSDSWKEVDHRDRSDLFFGLSASYPVGNHEARARFGRAVLNRRQAEEAVKNLEQLIQLDVRTAYEEVKRVKQQVAASAVTRRLDEVKLQAEIDKFKLGRSTSFQVARAQRDLVRSQLAEAETALEYRKALVELYRLEGSLLERRGVSAPGREPVEMKFVAAKGGE